MFEAATQGRFDKRASRTRIRMEMSREEEEGPMLKRLWRLLGLTTQVRTVDMTFDPVYGLLRGVVRNALACNPRLRKPSEAMPPPMPDKTGVS